jgi:transcriptional regulator with XRE-family HTH domain
MSPDSTGNRFARDPELAQLHEALISPDRADDHDDETEADERAAASLLPLDAGMLSPVVRSYVTELLIGGENPTPSTRQRLVEAANRGLRKRRADRAALPALLAFKREEANIPVAEVADALQVSTEDVYQMESGRLNIRNLDAEHIAKWVRAVRADPAVAVGALRHVLELSAASRSRQVAGRGRSGQLSDADQRLIDEVAALLGDA